MVIRTEDGGRQTALEDRVRARCPCSWIVTRCSLSGIWHFDFVFWHL